MANYKIITKLEKGDLVRVRRKAGYCHFGIASSDNTVIHYSDFGSDSVLDPSKVKVIETSLKDFLQGDNLEIRYPFDSPYSRDEIVSRARSYLGQYKFRDKGYDLATNNCEHFARYIYYNKATSRQVKAAAVAAGLLVAVGAGVLAIKSVVDKTKKKK